MEERLISTLGMFFMLMLILCFGGSTGKETHPAADEYSLQEARVSFADYDETWEQYKATYHKTYKDANDEAFRKSVFMKNVKIMEEHNRKYRDGESSYWMDLNQFTDMTVEEFGRFVTPNQPRRFRRSSDNVVCSEYKPSPDPPPESKDWKSDKYLTGIKDQGPTCGSCWAFASTSAMESHWAIKNGQLINLSDQQVLSCAKENGCKGGNAFEAFNYGICFGLERESCYPYVGTDNNCTHDSKKVVARFTGCRVIKSDEEEIKRAVGKEGPVFVGIFASDSFKQFGGGVFDEACNGQLNHAVLIVGYGYDTATKKDYWLVRNCWGTSKHVDGYIKMVRGKNICGIASMPSFPIAKAASPDQLGSSCDGSGGNGRLELFHPAVVFLGSFLMFLKW